MQLKLVFRSPSFEFVLEFYRLFFEIRFYESVLLLILFSCLKKRLEFGVEVAFQLTLSELAIFESFIHLCKILGDLELLVFNAVLLDVQLFEDIVFIQLHLLDLLEKILFVVQSLLVDL